MRKLTIEFIKEKCREHGVECLEKEYVNANTKMRFRCKCGNEYKVSWNTITNKNQWQCPECSLKNRAEKRKLDFNEIKKECLNHEIECLEDRYVNAKTKMRFRCKCGNEYVASWDSITNRNQWQCLECSKKKQAEKFRLDFNEIKKICREHDIECLEKEYVNANTKMRFKCKCGNEYEASWHTVTGNKQWQCPKCSIKNKAENQKLDLDEIKRKCEEHDIECLEEKYVDNRAKMRFRCKCGNEFERRWGAVTNGNQWQCPECSGKTSKGEKYTIEFLNKEGIQFKTQESLGCINPRTKKQLYYDFVIGKIIIEIDGEQHYRLVNFGTTEEKAEDDFNKTKYRDKIKEQYAKDNGYKLYRIKWFGSATNENIKKLNLELEKILKENNLI